jgi:hypothetical protein
MRQAIKGDGSDGSAALKAYLLAHNEVLAQELYEFTRPIPFVPGTASISGLPVLPPPTFPLTAGATSRVVIRPTAVALWDRPDIGTARGDALGVQLILFAVGLGSPKPNATFSGFSLPGGISPGSIKGVYPYVAMSGSSPTGYDAGVSLTYTDAHNSNFFGRFNTPGGWSQTWTGPNEWYTGYDFSSVRMLAIFGASLLAFGLSDVFNAVPALVIDFGGSGGSGGGGTSFESGSLSVTDAASALTYAGNTYLSAHIKNNGFKSKIGLDVDSLQLEWKFRGDEAMVTDPTTGATILTILQAFQYGLWDGVWVKWRRVYMPTFGDCDSLGAVSMFRGRIAEVEVDRLTAEITVNSITELFNRQVPATADRVEQSQHADRPRPAAGSRSQPFSVDLLSMRCWRWRNGAEDCC